MTKQIFVNLPVKDLNKTDEMIDKAIAAGGSEYRNTQDHGWMYSRAFEDIDGHIWEILYMDESKMTEEMKRRK